MFLVFPSDGFVTRCRKVDVVFAVLASRSSLVDVDFGVFVTSTSHVDVVLQSATRQVDVDFPVLKR